jgi:hypothetical protein
MWQGSMIQTHPKRATCRWSCFYAENDAPLGGVMGGCVLVADN